MRKRDKSLCGVSYKKRAREINAVYEHWIRTGLSNREIWRRYIYPMYGISERTLYNLLKLDFENFEEEGDAY